MIRGIHGMFYSSKADEMRTFIREKLKLPFSDVGEGWLIFDFEQGDLGVHPTEAGDEAMSGEHNISFFTDDVEGTVKELKSRGVTFEGDIQDHGYGLVTHFTMPGGVKVQLYQPRYKRTYRGATAKAAAKPAPAKKAVPAKKKAVARGRR